MADSLIIEGTAAEIASQLTRSKLSGRLHAVITTQPDHEISKPANTVDAAQKVLHGYGMFAGKLGGSERFAANKQVEIEREDRRAL